MIDLALEENGQSGRWNLSVTNNTGGMIHDFNLLAAGRVMSWPPNWPDGVSHTLRTWLPGVPLPDISVSYCVWYAQGDSTDSTPIEQVLPVP